MKKFKKILCLLLTGAMLTTALWGCGENTDPEKPSGKKISKESQDGGTLIIRAFGDPMSFNPDKLPDDNGYEAFQNMYSRLTKLDAAKKVVPDLAESWDIKDKGATITYHLRKNAKWHDGEAVTADDVKYTFDFIKEHDTYYLSSLLQQVKEIIVDDPHTVTFKLEKPNVAFVPHLSWYACFVVPKHVYEKYDDWDDCPEIKTNPIGSGGFKFAEFVQGEKVVLERFDDYYEGKPHLDKLIFQMIPDDATAVNAFKNGEIDVVENVPPANNEELLKDENIRMMLNEFPSPMRIVFNVNNKKVSDPAVRRAIAMCVDREEIVEKIYQGNRKPEYSMYPAIIEQYANTVDTAPKFDIKGARKVLEDAGYKPDKEGYYIKDLEIEVFEGGGAPDIAKLLQGHMKEAGMKMELNVSEFNAWAEKVDTRGKFCIELQGGFMGPDVSALYNRYGTGQSSNFAGYSNKKFDELMNKGIQEVNEEKRAEIYKEAQKILAEDLPFFPIVGFSSYDANNVQFKDLPIDGEGKWGWQEYSHTYLTK